MVLDIVGACLLGVCPGELNALHILLSWAGTPECDSLDSCSKTSARTKANLLITSQLVFVIYSIFVGISVKIPQMYGNVLVKAVGAEGMIDRTF